VKQNDKSLTVTDTLHCVIVFKLKKPFRRLQWLGYRGNRT